MQGRVNPRLELRKAPNGPLARPVRGFTCTQAAPAGARLSSRRSGPTEPAHPPHSAATEGSATHSRTRRTVLLTREQATPQADIVWLCSEANSFARAWGGFGLRDRSARRQRPTARFWAFRDWPCNPRLPSPPGPLSRKRERGRTAPCSSRAARSSPHENRPVRAGGHRVVVAANSFARPGRGLCMVDPPRPAGALLFRARGAKRVARRRRTPRTDGAFLGRAGE